MEEMEKTKMDIAYPIHKKREIFSKTTVVIGAILTTFGAGSIYCWGTLSVYVSEPGFYESDGSSKTSLCYAVATLMEPFSMFIGAQFERRITPRLTVLVAGILVACGWALSAVKIDIEVLILSYGILSGLGTGMAFVCALTTPMRHFRESSHGLLSGIILSAFSIGSLSFALMVESIANPKHIPANYAVAESYSTEYEWENAFHDSAAKNVPRAMMMCAAMAGSSIVIGSLLLRNPRRKPQTEEVAVNDNDNNDTPGAVNDVGPKEALRTVVFWQWFSAIVFFSAAELYTTRAFSEFAVHDCDFNVRYDLVGGSGALAMIIGRFFWGKFCDILGHKATMASCASIATVFMVAYFETRNSKAWYITATIFLFFSFAGGSVSVPTMIGQTFGQKHFSTNYSIIATAVAIASILQAIIPSLLLEVFGSHRVPFYCMSFFCVAAACLAGFS